MAYGSILGQTSSSIPSGVIVMWSGAANNIPNGWLLCDGNNNTPDLRNRFIVGAGSNYNVGNTGGSDSVILNVNQIPSHSHTFTGNSHTHSLSLSGLTTSSAGAHTHEFGIYERSNTGQLSKRTFGLGRYEEGGGRGNCGIPDYQDNYGWMDEAGAHTHTISGTGTLRSTTATGSISSTGGSQSHENRPPYYALCFIMKS